MAELLWVDLKELGEGQYIKIKNPKTLSWGFQKDMQAKFNENTQASYTEATEALVIKLVAEGKILDESGNPIPLPLTKERLPLMPLYAMQAVTQKYATISRSPIELPNG